MEIGDQHSLLTDILNLHLNADKSTPKTMERNELREVEYCHIKKLNELLESDDWKKIMHQIDGIQKGKRRFSSENIE